MLGVCSWSLRPDSPSDLAGKVTAAGLEAVQLALGPLQRRGWQPRRTRAALDGAGLTVRSGMMSTAGEDYTSLASIRATGGLRPTQHWGVNLKAAEALAALAGRLGLPLVTFHAGFLPEDRRSGERATLLGRLRTVAGRFAAHGVALALETGQETAATLLAVLEDLDRPDVGVNFDPANMLLYDKGDPVEALELLLPHVRQVHVKDARRTKVPGTWGEEVPVGEGEVAWPAFFDVLRRAGRPIDLMIEREAGDDRVGDVKRAAALVRELAPDLVGGGAA
jgi:sugar phosphate isomerase/epimerase